MLAKISVFLFSLLFSVLSFAVELNKADQTELDSVKGIGPAISKRIVEERSKNGPFRDWADFEKRVKGVGEKTAAKMSEAGLTVNGKPMNVAAAGTAKPEKDKNAPPRPASEKAPGKPADSASKSQPPATSGTPVKPTEKKESAPAK